MYLNKALRNKLCKYISIEMKVLKKVRNKVSYIEKWKDKGINEV